MPHHSDAHTHTLTHTLQQNTSDGFTAGDLVRDVKVYMLCVCVCVRGGGCVVWAPSWPWASKHASNTGRV